MIVQLTLFILKNIIHFVWMEDKDQIMDDYFYILIYQLK
jgi:hypothetical protein